ncbi:GGDEF domain-containing protein [Curvibacter gracilis]|uniref:GGDEF domain-containing protein n=1 Tax=Curvibacter gracilis TaxID=230310 RepID=UPI00146FB1E6|nr:GGDEF domain-containing protein [Curvibacter gracilis]
MPIHGMRLWGVAPLLALLSAGVYGLQDHLPSVAVTVAGNGLLMGATLLLLAGTSRFFERPWRWWPWAAMVSVCLVWIFAFDAIWPDYRARMLVFGLSMALICATHTRVLALHGRGLPSRVMLAAMGWQTLVLLARALSTYWIDTPATQRFDGGSVVQGIYIGTYSCSILLVLLGAQLMVNERVRDQFEQLATHDALTGMLNRRAIMALIELEHHRWKRHARPYAVMVVDVDHFKRVNDSYGHQAGDRALSQIAATLQASIRKADFIGRYGGEEFIVLLQASDPEATTLLARRLCQAVETRSSDAQTPRCTVSIGVAVVQQGDETIEPVIGRADQALYEAKAAGRNRVRLAGTEPTVKHTGPPMGLGQAGGHPDPA